MANLLFARQLNKRFIEGGINAIAISLHPGLIKTDEFPLVFTIHLKITNGFLDGTRRIVRPETQRAFDERMDPQQGALNTLFAATNPQVWEEREKFGGAYLVPHGQIEEPVGNGANDELAEELWETCEKVVNDILS